MNPERFTEASAVSLNTAQQIAQAAGNQTLTPAHVLRALTDNDTASRALTAAGADLRDLRAARPDDELFFITGADALAQILSWKDADELFDLAHFIGVTRPGYELSESGLPEEKVTLQEVPAMAISSTDCRDRVADGEPVWYLVPDGVVQYIHKYQLYGPRAGSLQED